MEKYKQIGLDLLKNIGTGFALAFFVAGTLAVIKWNYEFPALDFFVKGLRYTVEFAGYHQIGKFILSKFKKAE